MSFSSHTVSRDGLIAIRLVGEQLVPGSLRSRDLAQIIQSAEDMIASVVVRDNPHLSKDEVVVGLLSIESGSVNLRFASPLRTLVFPAFSEITRSIEKEAYEDLPPGAIKSLNKMSSFTRSCNCEVQFFAADGDAEPAAVMTPETVVGQMPLITGLATIYGEVIRVGGVEPRVMVGLATGEKVFCNVEHGLAKQLGQRLYSWVGLRGQGKWSAADFSLQEFRVKEITKFEDRPASEAMTQLAEQVGNYFGDIEDVEGYVADLRGQRGDG